MCNENGKNLPMQRVADAVREACIAAARQAYEEAGVSGLCHEGRWECAVGAMGSLDLAAVLAGLEAGAL